MRKRAINNIISVIVGFILALIACAMISCTSTKYVETIKTDTIYQTHHKIDSVQILDSVYVKEFIKGDTVVLEKTKYLFRDRTKLVTDTVKEVKVEYAKKPIEVEKKLTAWQKFKINAGEWLLGCICAMLVVFAILWVIKWRK